MQLQASTHLRRLAVGAAVMTSLSMAVAPASARRHTGQGPFGSLVGTWSGAGSVNSGNGQTEAIRCRATYTGNDSALGLDLVCASASFNLKVTSQINNQDGAVSGQWSEATRGLGGGITGRVRGNQIVTNVSGQNFTAAFNIAVNRNHSDVSIRPSGGDIAAVSITFRRSG